jgi:hypothetical protein
MSVEPQDDATGAVDDVEEQAADEVETEAEGTEDGDEAEANPDDGAEEETVVSFGEPKADAEVEAAPAWVKELRKKNRELAREAAQAKAEIARLTTPAKPKLAPRPTLEQFDFDGEKFEAALEAHLKQKAEVEAAEQEERKAQEAQAQEWGQTVQRYREAAKMTAQKAPDFAEAEANVAGSLSMVQQSIIMSVTDKPAEFILALGRDDERLAELAKINDAVKFTARIAKMETTLMVTTSKKLPKPARRADGANAPATSISQTTDRLLKESEKSNDLTGLVEELRRKKAK